MVTKEQREKLRRLQRAATPGPWRWWTSNSHRRLSSDATGKDGDVACGQVHPVDGWPDIRISEEDMAYMIACVNAMPAMLDALDALDPTQPASPPDYSI